MAEAWKGPLERVDDVRWKVPKSYKKCMRVDGIIYASDDMMESIKADQAPEQVSNVACLPGIVKYSLAMPDIHWGYGFPIGGVAAFDVENGVVSPGGVGYDINCGVRLLRTDLTLKDIEKKIEKLVDRIFYDVPSGVGSKGKLRISKNEVKEVLVKGSQWAVEKGYGWKEDLLHTEDGGRMEGANPERVSQRALERGAPQLGTLGSGNHFLEIQVIEEIYDKKAASIMGLEKGLITVMIHTGSRGLGYQICDDYVRDLSRVVQARYGINIPDRQLACAPVKSKDGRAYLEAMRCGANFAWANRQMITHWVREAFSKVMGMSPESMGMKLIYDVAHNIAKIEKHIVNGKEMTLVVHRKGATRAFSGKRKEVPEDYRSIGQPVIVPGDMGRYSFVLVGTDKAMEQTFGSTCHGAGRLWSRKKAKAETRNRRIRDELKKKGIIVRSATESTLREEVPDAYKDVSNVVDVLHRAGISLKVAKMRPLGVVKG